jgi:hypothetical protein
MPPKTRPKITERAKATKEVAKAVKDLAKAEKVVAKAEAKVDKAVYKRHRCPDGSRRVCISETTGKPVRIVYRKKK